MSTSVSSLTTNFFPSAQNGFTTTTSGSVSSGAATVGLNSVAGYVNGDIAVFVIDPTDSSKKQTFTGVIDTSGVQVTSVVWTAGTNQSHALGATVVDYVAAGHIDLISAGILVSHNADGTPKTGITYPASTFTTPTIADHTNAQHTHTSAAQGGTLGTDSVPSAAIQADSVTASKMLYGMVRARQGGTTGDGNWTTSGTSNTDTTAKDVFIQCGSLAVNANPATLTFPVAFNQIPIVLASVSSASGFNVYVVQPSSPSTTQAFFRTQTDTGANATSETVSWIAIGQ